ncbi:MAG TPA: DNA polymerase IV [archaeon]|nr:DNA polymerase IV [archaeon]
MNRVILHVDLDYFYAQTEELRKPELRGKPVIVCMFSGRTESSGAVAAANYKARELGVHAGMPIAFAKKKAPNGVFLAADREHYNEVSSRVMDILREYSDKFEQVSVDEAFVDATERCRGSYIEGSKLAGEIKKRVLEEEKLTCSIGVGPNKLIAKMASGVKKPDGMTLVTPGEVKAFLRSKRISDLHGIGDKTVEALAQKGIKTISELASADIAQLQEMFGENRGPSLREKALGIDESPVEEREKQQYSRIVTLKEDTSEPKKLISESEKLADELAAKSIEKKVMFKTISILLISDKLESVARSRTIEVPTQSKSEIIKVASELFKEFFEQNLKFVARRFGLRISNFSEPKKQKSILEFS